MLHERLSMAVKQRPLPLAADDVLPKRVEPMVQDAVMPAAAPTPPDVDRLIRLANERLAGPWTEPELRCGRGLVLGPESVGQEELKELQRTFVEKGWEVRTSIERRGVVVSFKPVPASKRKA